MEWGWWDGLPTAVPRLPRGLKLPLHQFQEPSLLEPGTSPLLYLVARTKLRPDLREWKDKQFEVTISPINLLCLRIDFQ